jgi:hypothetical protein
MTPVIERKRPTKVVQLTEAERKTLERMCNNRFNWTDGGHWMGAGTPPNCKLKERISNSISHTITFPTDSAALKWNLEWEKSIRYVGHTGTAALTTAVGLTLGGIPGIVIGTAAAITKDELQANVPYPRMARGWSYELIFDHEFKWSPHPYGQKGLTQKVITIIRDHNKKIQFQSSGFVKYSIEKLPEGLARELANVPSRKTNSIFN